MRNIDEMVKLAKSKESGKRVVVAGGNEREVLEALERARQDIDATGILVGNGDAIKRIADRIGLDLSLYTLVDIRERQKMLREAVDIIRRGDGDILMKGLVPTSAFMKAALDKEKGIVKEGELLSHVAVFEIPRYHKLLLITDVAVIIAPDLSQKVGIINNAVSVMRKLGTELPLVACVAAVEKVNPGKMPATEDAAILSKMCQRGQIKGCIVDGPLGFDNAISKEAAKIKKIDSVVAGNADIILCPDIEAGNILYKSLTEFAGAVCGAIVVGASHPLVVTSRADSDRTKFASIVLASICVE